ncbi:MAG: hypothetical protein WAK40_03385 [Thermoplasmata archaeon]
MVRLRAELLRFGTLPVSDPNAPSLVSRVAGAPISGSWWGHPAGPEIYRVAEALEADPDILALKLWRGKVTLVHRRLWPALRKIGTEKSAWQLTGLNVIELRLLAHLEGTASVRRARTALVERMDARSEMAAVRGLERRLLVLTRSVHTSGGAHALTVESWADWGARTRTPAFRGSLASAERTIEDSVRRLTPTADPRRQLPWGRPWIRTVR